MLAFSGTFSPLGSASRSPACAQRQSPPAFEAKSARATEININQSPRLDCAARAVTLQRSARVLPT
jgi:hypothetical protein